MPLSTFIIVMHDLKPRTNMYKCMYTYMYIYIYIYIYIYMHI